MSDRPQYSEFPSGGGIIGTAGHIDHGKTALVQALTGRDTDRLSEEKRRGISIELGFASMEFGGERFGIVDVPGHERFIRSMVAGSAATQAVLLVVAANESVAPQTREHLAILQHLGVDRGVVALTKIDLVEPDWADLVELEVRELIADTSLADLPIVRTSVVSGEGVEESKKLLATEVSQKALSVFARQGALPFRMPIDRVFSLPGQGTIVTGSIWSGFVEVGDTLQLQPYGREVRVRQIQSYDQASERAGWGQRAALNLADIHAGEIERGDELAAIGFLEASRHVNVRIDRLRGEKLPKDRIEIRLHTGAAAIVAELRWLDRREKDGSAAVEQPATSRLARLSLREPLACAAGQRLLLRQLSPAKTLVGGIILDPDGLPIRRHEPGRLERLAAIAADNEETRALAATQLRGVAPWSIEDLPRLAGVVDPHRVKKELVEQNEWIRVRTGPQGEGLIPRVALEDVAVKVVKRLDKMHDAQPLVRSFNESALQSVFPKTFPRAELWQALVSHAPSARRIRREKGVVGLIDRGPVLSKRENSLMESMIDEITAGGMSPPTVTDLKKAAGTLGESIPKLAALAAEEGIVVAISSEILVGRDALVAACRSLRENLQNSERMTLSEIKSLWNTSRKYAVPICEFLDKQGFTARQGERRVLADANLDFVDRAG